MLTPTVIVDNFEVKTDSITAYCLVDGKDIDFHFTKAEFEKFVEDNDMIKYLDEFGDFDASMTFEELYDDRPYMYKCLKQYIEYIYLMDAMDIETPIKKILL